MRVKTANSPEFRDLIRKEASLAGLSDDVTVNVEVHAEPDRWGTLQYQGLVLKVIYGGHVVATSPILQPKPSLANRNVRVMRRLFKAAAKSIKNLSI